MKCIICRLERNDFSDEHVIPDSLGGYYHIYSVCKRCNSDLGSNVDSALVNHGLSNFYRFAEDMSGKSGKTPNPFPGIFVDKEDPKKRARVEIDSDGNISPKFLPLINYIKNGDDIVSVQIEVDAQDEKELDVMIGKIAKRLDIPEQNFSRDNLLRKEVGQRELSGKLTIDTHRFKIGLLKIAYEFAVDSIPEYFDDEDAVKIAEILKNCRHDKTTEYVNIGNGLDPKLFESFDEWLDLGAKKHFLVLTASDDGLFALIRLNGTFAVGVKLSKQRHLSEAELIFGVNDIKERTFKKFTGEEAINQIFGPLATQLGYFFETETEARAGISIINSCGYHYEGQQSGDIPLYRRDGTYSGVQLADKLLVASVQSWNDGLDRIDEYTFDENDDLFVKALPSGTLLRVNAIRMSRTRLRKL